MTKTKNQIYQALNMNVSLTCGNTRQFPATPRRQRNTASFIWTHWGLDLWGCRGEEESRALYPPLQTAGGGSLSPPPEA